MHASIQNRRRSERQRGTIVSIENVTYKVLRNYQQMVKTPLKAYAGQVTLIEAISPSINERGGR